MVSIVVVLEGSFHAFAYFDELALSALRASRRLTGQESLKILEPSELKDCSSDAAKYTVVLLPNAILRSRRPTSQASVPAKTNLEGDFAFNVLLALQRLEPSVLAVDFDLSQSEYSAERAKALIAPPAASHPNSETRLALVALPMSDAQDDLNRAARNQWLANVCKNPNIAVASPLISLSPSFGNVIQFYWQALPEPGLPPAYPSLGQVARQLADGMDAKKAAKGTGLICRKLQTPPADARIPFVDFARTVVEQNDDLFAAAANPDRHFSIEWLNPAALDKDISLVRLRDTNDLQTLVQEKAACIKDKIVVLGSDATGSYSDSFPTASRERTPGAVVHAMVAMSAERTFRSVLALSASVDIVVGLALTAVLGLLRPEKYRNSDSMFQRNLHKLLDVGAPFLAVVAACALSMWLIDHGWFLNPIIVMIGVWLHSVLHRFFDWARPEKKDSEPVSKSRLVRFGRALLPQVRRAQSGALRYVDIVVYWGSLCVFVLVTFWAASILVSRAKLVFF